MNYLFNRKVQLIILVALLAAVVWASRWGTPSMFQNLIAEAVGIALGVLLTVTLVEKMLERRRRKKWGEVRSQVLRAISYDIIDIALEYMIHFLGHPDYIDALFDGGSRATLEATQEMTLMLDQIRQLGDAGRLPVQALFRETEWRFNHLRDVLTPKLIEFGDEPRLIEHLMDIDEQYSAWKNHLLGFQREPATLQRAFGAATDTLEALVELYRYLATSQVVTPI